MPIDQTNIVTFWLNGKQVTLKGVAPDMLLADYLHQVGLTGTKVVCGQGGCGACTVMLSEYDRRLDRVSHRSVNACMRLVYSVHGTAVTTVEGVGSVREALDPVQFRIAAGNGSQCGFCTPGFVMSMVTFLENNPNPSEQEIEDAFDGNICRCTGYRPILQSMRTFAGDGYESELPATPGCGIDPQYKQLLQRRTKAASEAEELLRNAPAPAPLHLQSDHYQWYRPASLDELYEIKGHYAEEGVPTRLVFGNTSVGIFFDEALPRVLIDISGLASLRNVVETDAGLEIGGNATVQEMVEFLADVIGRRPAAQTTGLVDLHRHSLRVGSRQVRNAGSVAGNLYMTISHDYFASDLFTTLGMLGATMTIGSRQLASGSATFPILETPAAGDLPGDAVILSVHIPYTEAGDYVQSYKIAHRDQNAHPIMNAAFQVHLPKDGIIQTARIVLGGLSARAMAVTAAEEAMVGRGWNAETLAEALAILKNELGELKDPPGSAPGEQAYRRSLAATLFYKFFLSVVNERNPREIDPAIRSAAHRYARPLSHGQQEYDSYPEEYPVNQPLVKRSAFLQATGEARYTHDVPLPPGGVHAALITSSQAHAKFRYALPQHGIEGVSALAGWLAEQHPSFVALVTHEDLPEERNMMGLFEDDPIFAPGFVTYAGGPVGLVLAESAEEAWAMAKFVGQHCLDYYEKLETTITLDDAVKKNQIFKQYGFTNKALAEKGDKSIDRTHIPAITRPGSDEAWLEDPSRSLPGSQVVFGSQKSLGQAQFYLETQATVAIPGEHGQMTLYVSTQDPSNNQVEAAQALGVSANQVTVIVKRIGGGFGGKQTRTAMTSCAVAVAAQKVNRPVRFVLDRYTDMALVGKRHPFTGNYAIAFDEEGTINGLRTDFLSDGGNTYDVSFPVMDLAQLLADNVYQVDNYKTTGTVYQTNKASNTAFRSFGTIQCILIQESAIEHMAHELSRNSGRRVLPEEIRRQNMYKSGSVTSYDTTPYGQRLMFCNIRELWDDLLQSSDFKERAAGVERFNQENRWRKRGISMIPLKYGVSYTGPRGTFNQGGALVNVYQSDGSVLVMHGGIEMGQGINTKMAQIAAETLGIPIERIRIGSTNVSAVPNTIATAASTGTDLNGGAVAKACRQLRERLEEFCAAIEQYRPHDPENGVIENWRVDWAGCWDEIVRRAYDNRINLSCQARYKTPHYSSVDIDHPHGSPFFYFTYSAAVSEVEIDVLTGAFTIVRSDLLYDPGKSINPCLDIGQMEGSFVQGVGHVTSEQLLYDDEGKLLTVNTGSYILPGSKSIPVDFRVRLTGDATPAPRAQATAVKSSKGIGEPPLVLAASVFFGIRHAIAAARSDQGDDEWFELAAPATVQDIQTACQVGVEALRLWR